MTSRRLAQLAPALIGLLALAVVFAPTPGGRAWLSRVHDFAHAPIFGCVAVLTLLGGRRLRGFSALSAPLQYAAAFLIAVVLGVLTEAAQLLTGRDAAWSDLAADVMGALAFLAVFAAVDAHARPWLRSGASRALSAVAGVALFAYLSAPLARAAFEYYERYQQLPMLADFTRGFDPYFVAPIQVVLADATLPAHFSAKADERAARVRFLPAAYPGVNFHEPWPDWRGYAALAIDLTNPADEPLDLVVRVHDDLHDNEYADRFNRPLQLPPKTRQVLRIPLEEIETAPRGRSMDMGRIAGVVLFRANASSPEELYVSRLWLE